MRRSRRRKQFRTRRTSPLSSFASLLWKLARLTRVLHNEDVATCARSHLRKSSRFIPLLELSSFYNLLFSSFRPRGKDCRLFLPVKLDRSRRNNESYSTNNNSLAFFLSYLIFIPRIYTLVSCTCANFLRERAESQLKHSLCARSVLHIMHLCWRQKCKSRKRISKLPVGYGLDSLAKKLAVIRLDYLSNSAITAKLIKTFSTCWKLSSVCAWTRRRNSRLNWRAAVKHTDITREDE